MLWLQICFVIRVDHREPVTPIADIISEDTIRSYFEDVMNMRLVFRSILFEIF